MEATVDKPRGRIFPLIFFLVFLVITAIATVVAAADEPPQIDTGDTAWVLMASALVLLMTPALAFFYGGLVRRKNVLSVLMQCFLIMCLISIQWVLFGYTPRVRAGRRRLDRQSRLVRAQGRRPGAVRGLRGDHPAPGVHDLPDDVRDHHPGADHRRVRRADEVRGLRGLLAALGDAGLRPGLPLGLGHRRLHAQLGRARFRRRHGRAHQRRHRRARRGARARQAHRLPGERGAAAQPALRGARRRPALVRLVRLQRRQRARRGLAGNRRLRRDPRGERGRGPDLVADRVDAPRAADRPRHHHRRGGGSRRHHPGRGVRQPDRRDLDRHRRVGALLPLRGDPEGQARLRRHARRLRRARRRRDLGRDRHRALRDQDRERRRRGRPLLRQPGAALDPGQGDARDRGLVLRDELRAAQDRQRGHGRAG